MEGGEDASLHLDATAQQAGNYSLYSHVFEFEKKFDERVAQDWVLEHWVPMTAWTGSIYVILVFTGQAWMASRPAYQLRGPLAAWSTFLAVFSICGFVRVFPEFVHSLTTGGLYDSVCNSNFVEHNKVSGFWTFLFTLSKMPELGDTVFIVLRKQQLIFLHWYHHLTVLVYTFYCFSQFTSTCRWFMTMNYFVHALMYTYFALRALRVRVPKGIAVTITSLQLVQMVVGCTINYLAFQFKQNGRKCGVSNDNLVYGSIMYFSYFLLFARFFYKAYFCKSERKSQEKLTELPANDSPVSFGTVLQAGGKLGSNKECDSFIAGRSNIDSSEEEKKKEK